MPADTEGCEMNTYNASGGFAASASADRLCNRRSPFATAHEDPTRELHNSRGLVIAVLMSAACWAGVGLAFLI
jgi:hypothetical protein